MKTALFLCECGPNIADRISLDTLRDWAEARDDVAFVASHSLLCSPAGKEHFREQLTQNGVDRIVVAACTPRMHEKTFRDLAAAAGLDPGSIAIANIREHCAWVTKDPAAATAKARSLVAGALARAATAEPLESRSMEVETDLLVIGGGIAAIEATLTAAEAGRGVTLVTRDIAVGGGMAKTEELAPSLECAPCVLSSRLTELREATNVKVRAGAEVTEVKGFYGNFTATIRERPRYVTDACIACDACLDPCPVTVPHEFHLGLGTRKAIHGLYPGAVPAAFAIDPDACLHFGDEGCEACVPACPFGAIDLTHEARDHEVTAGAVVVATGLESAHVDAFPELGRGAGLDVLTLPEFERYAASTGPTGGRILCRDGREPESLAVLLCAGSLRPDGLPYCSGTCCMEGVKVARLFLAAHPDSRVHIVHGDLVLPGAEGARFMGDAKQKGVRFHRVADIHGVTVGAEHGRPRLHGQGLELPAADIVVLATGLAPRADTAEIAARLDIETTEDGFFRAGDAVTGETTATRPGIFLAGSASGPCGAAGAVTRARAAAGDAISKLVPGRRIDLCGTTATIDPVRCAGCRLCETACPYRAVGHDPVEGVCAVNEAICHGCGTCAAGCPSGAARARHFSDEQIFAEIAGLIHG